MKQEDFEKKLKCWINKFHDLQDEILAIIPQEFRQNSTGAMDCLKKYINSLSKRETITVWRDGTWKEHSAADASYCRDDPDWLTEIPTIPKGLPKIVCLCGSCRFYKEYQQAEFDLTMAGHIYLSIGFYPLADDNDHKETLGINPDQKIELDELHKRKIYMCDEVFVINVGGYVGDSTKSEIRYAKSLRKTVNWLEPELAWDDSE